MKSRNSFSNLCRCLLVLFVSATSISCSNSQQNPPAQQEIHKQGIGLPIETNAIKFDSNEIVKFYAKYPLFKEYKKQFDTLYAGKNQFIWQTETGLKEVVNNLVTRIHKMELDGIAKAIPYKDAFYDMLHIDENGTSPDKANPELELMITGQYFNFVKETFAGGVSDKLSKIGWFLPTKKIPYAQLLQNNIQRDTIEIQSNTAASLVPQYKALKEQLAIYQLKEKNTPMETVVPSIKGNKGLKLNDTASLLLPNLSKRLVELGYLKTADTATKYGAGLMVAINETKKIYGLKPDSLITNALIKELNVPIKKRVQQLLVNMERMRWIPKDSSSNEFILVNIPEFQLHYFENGKEAWNCNVVVGAQMTKSVIFSGIMQYVVLSPYWNIPQSIITKDVIPGMARNKNYLAEHRMEWNGGQVRQIPGPGNSLGAVKFIFPNVNNIYLHDTPAKSLFSNDSRAYSHGCIRVGKPRDLAIRVLKQDPSWTEAKIDAAMHATKETTVVLKKKIPVYIGYFTAFLDKDGKLNFRDDVYGRDDKLYKLIAE